MRRLVPMVLDWGCRCVCDSSSWCGAVAVLCAAMPRRAAVLAGRQRRAAEQPPRANRKTALNPLLRVWRHLQLLDLYPKDSQPPFPRERAPGFKTRGRRHGRRRFFMPQARPTSPRPNQPGHPTAIARKPGDVAHALAITGGYRAVGCEPGPGCAVPLSFQKQVCSTEKCGGFFR